MIPVAVPGFGSLELRFLVLDYNGTLAVDGRLLPGVREALALLADDIEIHVITADTFGLAGVRNDRKMLAAAAVGVAVVQAEGASAETIAEADIVAPGIVAALELLRHPKRLVATLRA